MICVSCKEQSCVDTCPKVIKVALELAVERGKIPAYVAVRTAAHMSITLEPDVYRQARTLENRA